MSRQDHDVENDESDFSPSAGRLVDSLRDTGYVAAAAFADIVDNSIAANATKIRIELLYILGEVRVVFIDNGNGMAEDQLVAGMRYGAPKRDNPKSLGKFGMGLKTASTAFCERLVVISMRQSVFCSRAWDLEMIRRKDKWILETPDPNEYLSDQEELEEFCDDSTTGTMVIWEKVDRLVSLNNEKLTLGLLKDLAVELADELSAVFSTFLDHSNDDDKDVDITLVAYDGEEIQLTAWDPLCLSLNRQGEGAKTQYLKEKVVSVTLSNGTQGHFTIGGSILPRQNELTREEEKEVRYTLDNQGFYIYRERRLIWHDGWPQRMYKKESKITRLRIVLNFDHELDDLFSIDFRKSRIIIPKEIRDELKKLIAPWRNHTLLPAKVEEVLTPSRPDGRHTASGNAIDKHLDHTKVSQITIGGGKAHIRNSYNLLPTEIDGIRIYEDIKVRVIEEESLLGNCLWDSALDLEGNTCLQLGKSHPYFERMYQVCKDTPDAIVALDMLLWSLANAELGTWSETNKIVMEQFRQHVSANLNHLCLELPEADED